MVENVFKVLLGQKLVTAVQLEEAIPSKGKPAKKRGPLSTIWVVRFVVNNKQVEILESMRGGPREWASLDKLNKWLRSNGIPKYEVKSNA